MASLKELPKERRLNTRIGNTDFGLIHRIDGHFGDKLFSSGFDLTEDTEKRIGVLSDDLHYHFVDHERHERSPMTHEPFYFACAVTSLIEKRPRIALSKRQEPSENAFIDLTGFDGVVRQYLHRNPNVDGLLEAYADRLSVTMFDEDTDYHPGQLTFPRLFGGLTFFLLECENVLEYEAKKSKK